MNPANLIRCSHNFSFSSVITVDNMASSSNNITTATTYSTLNGLVDIYSDSIETRELHLNLESVGFVVHTQNGDPLTARYLVPGDIPTDLTDQTRFFGTISVAAASITEMVADLTTVRGGLRIMGAL